VRKSDADAVFKLSFLAAGASCDMPWLVAGAFVATAEGALADAARDCEFVKQAATVSISSKLRSKAAGCPISDLSIVLFVPFFLEYRY
jgi:hypothetical protein